MFYSIEKINNKKVKLLLYDCMTKSKNAWKNFFDVASKSKKMYPNVPYKYKVIIIQ